MIGKATRSIAARELGLPPQRIRDTWDALHSEGTLACAPTPSHVHDWVTQAATNPNTDPHLMPELNRASLLTLVGITPTPAEWHAARHLTRCAPLHANPPTLNLPTDRPLRVAIDMDDVSYGWTDMIRDYVAKQVGANPDRYRVKEHYDFFDGWDGMTKDEVLAIYGQAVTDRVAYTSGKPMPGAKAGFDAIRAAGHTLVVITARVTGHRDQVTEDSLAWLDQEGMTPDEFHVTADKNTVDFDVILDDSTRNTTAALGAGREAMLFSRIYNHAVPANLAARRVFGWDHALALLGIPAVGTVKQANFAA